VRHRSFSERRAAAVGARCVLVNSVGTGAGRGENAGAYGYSYGLVLDAFRPLLSRWGTVVTLRRPESQVEYAVARARKSGGDPLVLSFVPFQDLYLTPSAPQVVYPLWEFPDVPRASLQGNPRYDWVRLANRVSLVLTAATFTAEALVRAGVRTPVRVVPVPLDPEGLQLPAWDGSGSHRLPVKGLVLDSRGQEGTRVRHAGGPSQPSLKRRILLRGKVFYTTRCRRWLPARADDWVTHNAKRFLAHLPGRGRGLRPTTPTGPLELSGVVYTSIFNPDDGRKNWQDLVQAFVLGLRDCPDATLVLKLVTSPKRAPFHRARLAEYCASLGVPCRCRVVLISDWLSPAQMRDLARATAYYVNATRAEGACLPLQEMMAAGRPGLSPVHSAMGDYFGEDAGFVVDSHPEPTSWPGDPRRHLTTTWGRLVWQSLHDQFQESYAAAREPGRYGTLAARARQRIAAWAGPERVGRLLTEALNLVESRRRPTALPA
jgi:hypothetical protein